MGKKKMIQITTVTRGHQELSQEVPPIGIQIKEGEMGKKHYSKFSSLLLTVEIHKNTDNIYIIRMFSPSAFSFIKSVVS